MSIRIGFILNSNLYAVTLIQIHENADVELNFYTFMHFILTVINQACKLTPYFVKPPKKVQLMNK